MKNKIITLIIILVSVNSYSQDYQNLITGKLSLLKAEDNYYLKNDEFGIKQIEEKTEFDKSIFKAGIISVYINKCNSSVNLLRKYGNYMTLKKLTEIVNDFNVCNISDEVQIADEVIEISMLPKERIQFGISLGYQYLKSNFSNQGSFPNSDSGISNATIGAKIYFLSNFLKNKLIFNASSNYFLGGKVISENNNYSMQSTIKFFRGTIGIEYLFNEVDSQVNPYIGSSFGLIFDNSHTTISPNSNGLLTLTYNAENKFIYTFNAGVKLNLINQNFDIIAEYQPTLKRKYFNNLDTLDNQISGVNLRLIYLF